MGKRSEHGWQMGRTDFRIAQLEKELEKDYEGHVANQARNVDVPDGIMAQGSASDIEPARVVRITNTAGGFDRFPTCRYLNNVTSEPIRASTNNPLGSYAVGISIDRIVSGDESGKYGLVKTGGPVIVEMREAYSLTQTYKVYPGGALGVSDTFGRVSSWGDPRVYWPCLIALQIPAAGDNLVYAKIAYNPDKSYRVPVILSSRTNSNTYVGTVYANGVHVTATETNVDIRIRTINAGEYLRIGNTFVAEKQVWSDGVKWTIEVGKWD